MEARGYTRERSIPKSLSRHDSTVAQHLILAIIALLLLSPMVACTAAPSTQPWETAFETPGSWDLSSDAAADVMIQDGKLLIHILQPGQIAWTTAGQSFADFLLQVEATKVAGPEDNEYGVLIRMDENDHFYAFSISSDGYARVARYEEGNWMVMGPDWFPHDAIHQGTQTNILEVEARGAQLSFRVNGEEVTTVEDTTLAKGDVGLYAGAFENPDVQIAFDNLRVTP